MKNVFFYCNMMIVRLIDMNSNKVSESTKTRLAVTASTQYTGNCNSKRQSRGGLRAAPKPGKI